MYTILKSIPHRQVEEMQRQVSKTYAFILAALFELLSTRFMYWVRGVSIAQADIRNGRVLACPIWT